MVTQVCWSVRTVRDEILHDVKKVIDSSCSVCLRQATNVPFCWVLSQQMNMRIPHGKSRWNLLSPKMASPSVRVALLCALLAPASAYYAVPSIACSTATAVLLRSPSVVAALPANEKCSFVLLAGGSGSRMKADRPKQFLDLLGKPVLQWDLELLLSIEGIDRIVLVISEEFRQLPFLEKFKSDKRLVFAQPGKERQNSVENGLAGIADDCTLVALHDAARPLVTLDAIERCFADAAAHDAAVLAVPCKPTIKESNDGKFVLRTLDRSKLWDIQTPQILRPQMLRDGFVNANQKKLAVTDDVSVVELMGRPVKLTVGEYTNLKLTTPEDMIIAETILKDRGERRQRSLLGMLKGLLRRK